MDQGTQAENSADQSSVTKFVTLKARCQKNTTFMLALTLAIWNGSVLKYTLLSNFTKNKQMASQEELKYCMYIMGPGKGIGYLETKKQIDALTDDPSVTLKYDLVELHSYTITLSRSSLGERTMSPLSKFVAGRPGSNSTYKNATIWLISCTA
jgi:hypothetical protein